MLRKLYFLYFIFCLLLFSTTAISQQDNTIIQGPFSTNLIRGGELFFERKTDDSIDFILKYKDGSNLKTQLIDNYEIEGGDPEIESVFFFPVLKHKNIFVIVSWEINSRGVGTYGKLYQVYAYTKSNDNNAKLIKNINLYNDQKLTGIDGTSDWEESHFKYKTAADVKKYINETYNKKK